MKHVQRRWVCSACDREWVFVQAVFDAATGRVLPWDEASCPTCRSGAIERVEYLPVCPGADTRSSSAVWAGAEASVIPPVPERKELHRDRNEALMRVDPYAEQLSALLGVSL